MLVVLSVGRPNDVHLPTLSCRITTEFQIGLISNCIRNRTSAPNYDAQGGLGTSA